MHVLVLKIEIQYVLPLLIFFCSFHKREHYRVFWCQHGKNGGCPCQVRKDLVSGICTSNGIPHSHPPEIDEQLLVQAVNEIVVVAATSNDQPRMMFDSVRRE